MNTEVDHTFWRIYWKYWSNQRLCNWYLLLLC